MSGKKKNRGTHNEFPMNDNMCLTGTVSTSDCTGMIPAGSVDSAEKFDESNRLHEYSKKSRKGIK